MNTKIAIMTRHILTTVDERRFGTPSQIEIGIYSIQHPNDTLDMYTNGIVAELMQDQLTHAQLLAARTFTDDREPSQIAYALGEEYDGKTIRSRMDMECRTAFHPNLAERIRREYFLVHNQPEAPQ